MTTKTKSWDHTVEALSVDDLARARSSIRGLVQCSLHLPSGSVCGPMEFACSYRCRKGRTASLHSRRTSRYCREHAERFAERYGLELPASHLGEIGAIVPVVFHGDRERTDADAGSPWSVSGRAYRLKIDGFRSALAERVEIDAEDELLEGDRFTMTVNPDLVRDGEELEVWLPATNAWAPVRFRWNGTGDAMIELEFLSALGKPTSPPMVKIRGLEPYSTSRGLWRKSIEPDDVFRVPRRSPLLEDGPIVEGIVASLKRQGGASDERRAMEREAEEGTR